jgi:hypothetical protein
VASAIWQMLTMGEPFAPPAVPSMYLVAIGGVAAGVGGGLDQRQLRYPGPCLVNGPRRSRSPDCMTNGHPLA